MDQKVHPSGLFGGSQLPQYGTFKFVIVSRDNYYAQKVDPRIHYQRFYND